MYNNTESFSAATNSAQEYHTRYTKIRNQARDAFYRKSMSRNRRQAIETEIAWLSNDIETYGFSFFPEHYIEETLQQLSKVVSRI